MLIRPVPSIVSPPTPIGVGGFRGADSLILDFYSGTLDPRISFTGGANRTYIDSLGVLQDSSTNVARFDHLLSTTAALGLSIYEGRTNGIQNNTMGGASTGTPGTLPTNWGVTTQDTTQEIVAVGTLNGIAYIDIKFSGTPSADPFLTFDTSTGINASTGETWTLSAYIAIIAGDITNINDIRLEQRERTDAGADVLRHNGPDFKGSLTSTLQRFDYTVTLSGGVTTARLWPFLFYNWDGSGDIDLTLRIGLPQEEQGAGASPVIKTTNAAVTATADVATNTSPIIPKTILVRARTSSGGETQVLWQFDDGTANNRYRLLRNSSDEIRLFVTTGGVERITSGLNMGTVGDDTNLEVAVRIEEADYEGSLDGASTVTDTSAGSLPTLTTHRLGRDTTGNYWNSTIGFYEQWPYGIIGGTLRELTQ